MVFLELSVIALCIVVTVLGVKYIYLRANFDRKVSEWLQKEEVRIRKDAIERSARTLSGKTLEKLIPFLEKFPYNSHDLRWLGDPIDFIVFDGYSEKSPKGLVFVEVKSGNGELTKSQNQIKELIEKKKVKWFEFRI